VVVSNQVQAVATDAAGAFRLDASQGYGIVFVSLPDGYESVGRFWQRIPESPGGPPLSFALTPRGASAEFTFVHASDTHLSEESLPRMRKLRELTDSLRPAFVLVTGDLVRDALRVSEEEAGGYYQMYVRETGRFSMPVWSVPGNHENFGIERHLSLVSPKHPLYGKKMYHHFLGPNYYSFNWGGVHFLALDTVDFDDLWYYGHVDETQLAWLEQDLALVPPGTTVVTFNHIPLLGAGGLMSGYTEEPPAPTLIRVKGKTQFRHVVSNTSEVLARFKRHQHTLALGGHFHARESLEFEMEGGRSRFHQAAAVVGKRSGGGFELKSGVTVYEVRAGKIDDGRFIPLDP
jgi:3',5'-cyclic AMP phosphodiesterase CpdA